MFKIVDQSVHFLVLEEQIRWPLGQMTSLTPRGGTPCNIKHVYLILVLRFFFRPLQVGGQLSIIPTPPARGISAAPPAGWRAAWKHSRVWSQGY
jgi:hypothetical protein